MLAQVKPVAQAAQAMRAQPSPPTGRATGVEAAVPVIRAPFAVTQAQGIAGAGAVAQAKPVRAVEQAVKIWPSVPTGRAEGVLAAVPVTSVPLAVMQAFGMYGYVIVDQQSPFVAVEQATRI